MQGVADQDAHLTLCRHRFASQQLCVAAARQVNKIRDVPGHDDFVVTHSDCKELYVWDTKRQPPKSNKARPRPGHAWTACGGRDSPHRHILHADSPSPLPW